MGLMMRLFLLSTICLSACKTLPDTSTLLNNIPFTKSSEQRAGETALADGDFDRAFQMLQKAADKDPDDKDIQSLLNQAQRKAAEEHYRKGMEAEQSSDPRLAASEFKQALSLLDKSEYRARSEQASIQLARLTREVNGVLNQLEKPNRLETAIHQAETLVIYQASFPELKSKLAQSRQLAGELFRTQTNELITQRQFSQAHESALKAANLSRDLIYESLADATEMLVSAREKIRANDYASAVTLVDAALQHQPHNQAIKDYHEELSQQAAGQLFNHGLRASSGGHFLEAIQTFTTLQRLHPDMPGIDQQKQRNQKLYAEENQRKAEALAKTKGSEAAGRILLHYLLASHFDPGNYELKNRMQQARNRMLETIKQRVSINFTNKSREPGAGEYVRDRLLDGLRDSGLRNVTVLEREHLDQILKEQGLGQGFLDESTAPQVKKIRGVQTQIAGTVISVQVRESGQNQPSYDSVRYKSGTRYVPNPKYRKYQAEVNEAQEDVYRAQRDLNQARKDRQGATATYDPNRDAVQNQLSLLGQVVADGDVSSAESALDAAERRLSSARSRLTREPPQIEEPVYAEARYPIYNLRLDGEVKLSFRLFDTSTSAVGQTHSINVKDSVEDRYVPGDPVKGIDDDPKELPPENLFRQQLLDKAVTEAIARLNAEFSQYAQEYLQRALTAKQHGVIEEAAEFYMRYLTAKDHETDTGVEEARQFFVNYYGAEVSP